MKQLCYLCLLLLMFTLDVGAQHFKADYYTVATLRDEQSRSLGEADKLLLKGGWTQILGYQRHATGRPVLWMGSLTAKFVEYGADRRLKPLLPAEQMINTGMTFTHVRPLSERWNFIGAFGFSLHALSDYVRWGSLTTHGGAIFTYMLDKGMDIGVGLGMTSNYGFPLILPMPYFSWKRPGKYAVTLNVSGLPRFTISTQLSPKLSLTLHAIEWDNISALVRTEEGRRLFTSTSLSSSLGVEHKLSKHWSWHLGVGSCWYNTLKLTERNWSGFWDSITGDTPKMKFKHSLRFSAGVNYSMQL